MLHIFRTFWHWNLQPPKTITSWTQVDMITGSPVPTCHWGSVVNAKQCGWTTDKAVVDVHRRIRCRNLGSKSNQRVLSTGSTRESLSWIGLGKKKPWFYDFHVFVGDVFGGGYYIIIDITLFKAGGETSWYFRQRCTLWACHDFLNETFFQKDKLHTPAIYMVME